MDCLLFWWAQLQSNLNCIIHYSPVSPRGFSTQDSRSKGKGGKRFFESEKILSWTRRRRLSDALFHWHKCLKHVKWKIESKFKDDIRRMENDIYRSLSLNVCISKLEPKYSLCVHLKILFRLSQYLKREIAWPLLVLILFTDFRCGNNHLPPSPQLKLVWCRKCCHDRWLLLCEPNGATHLPVPR